MYYELMVVWGKGYRKDRTPLKKIAFCKLKWVGSANIKSGDIKL